MMRDFTLIKTPLLFLFLVLVIHYNASAQWTSAGTNPFLNQTAGSLTSISDGNSPYVAFIDATQDYKISCMKFNGSTWSYLGGAGISDAGAVNITAFANNEDIYVVYGDAARSYKVTVKKFNGVSWNSVGTEGFATGHASNFNLAVVEDTLYLAYLAYSGGNIYLYKFNGTDWEAVPNSTIRSSSNTGTKVEMKAYSDTLALLYWDYTSAKAELKLFKNNTWVNLGDSKFGNTKLFTLGFNGDIPYVGLSSAGTSKATVLKYDNNQWDTVGTSSFSANEIHDISLTFAHQTPYIAFLENHDALLYPFVRKFDGGSWVPFSNFTNAASNSMTLTSTNDHVYAFFRQATSGTSNYKGFAYKTAVSEPLAFNSPGMAYVTKPNVYVKDEHIHVEKEGNYTMSVHSVLGKEIYFGGCSGNSTLDVPGPGVYIVNVEGHIFKLYVSK